MNQEEETAKEIIELFKEKGWTLSTAESCTGGNIAHNITLIAGSSAIFKGGVVSYSNEVKMNILGVHKEDLDQHGAVSQPVVEQMAKGAANVLRTDFAVATSGVAGPGGGTPEKPVGTVWIAASNGDEVISKKCLFGKERKENIRKATLEAFFLLKEFVKK
ncbi:MAG: CinA family protein [Paludibacteraceae bacterium]|nr:CinA family protein [Paludibacteraceae bacterium]